MSSDKKWLTLKTTEDNEEFVVEESVAIMSNVIKNMVEDGCASSVIPVPRVKGNAMGKIIEFCKKHTEESDEKVLKEFDAEFLNLGPDALYDLMVSANFLEIKVLLDSVTTKVADMIKGKSSEEIRNILKIENDLSAEEIEESRRENCWTRQE
ncbi:hypothetical protein ACET3Z_006434 [Daucus carota]|uniref:SKP1-like protein n=2 Tax=Daucus carota subsp. sativus TaxID=79200 RepID=A0A166DR54_DAUCS|nr:PREDICTED: SKP1-like protein 1A isoform X2 [Daucus carota subsp. sativus]XP_017236677.1 PREDICTED: SKP1-like protein 1A isoform X2 [Daucus carota subsp. sativus]